MEKITNSSWYPTRPLTIDTTMGEESRGLPDVSCGLTLPSLAEDYALTVAKLVKLGETHGLRVFRIIVLVEFRSTYR